MHANLHYLCFQIYQRLKLWIIYNNYNQIFHLTLFLTIQFLLSFKFHFEIIQNSNYFSIMRATISLFLFYIVNDCCISSGCMSFEIIFFLISGLLLGRINFKNLSNYFQIFTHGKRVNHLYQDQIAE
jgi:hypothetical protein